MDPKISVLSLDRVRKDRLVGLHVELNVQGLKVRLFGDQLTVWPPT